MNWLGASLMVVIFAMLIHLVKMVQFSIEVVQQSKRSVAVMLNSELDDDAKEVALRSHAVNLFTLLILLIAGSAVALLAPVGLIWILDLAGFFSFKGVLEILQRWDFLVGATIVGIGIYLVLRKLTP